MVFVVGCNLIIDASASGDGLKFFSVKGGKPKPPNFQINAKTYSKMKSNYIEKQKQYNTELGKIYFNQLQETRKIYGAVVRGEITETEKENQLCKLEFATEKQIRKLQNKCFNY